MSNTQRSLGTIHGLPVYVICNTASDDGLLRCGMDAGHIGQHHSIEHREDFVREDEYCTDCGAAATEHTPRGEEQGGDDGVLHCPHLPRGGYGDLLVIAR